MGTNLSAWSETEIPLLSVYLGKGLLVLNLKSPRFLPG